MIKAIASSLFALYISTSYGQVPPIASPQVPAVPIPPQPSAVVTPSTTQASMVVPPPPSVVIPPPNVELPPQRGAPTTPQVRTSRPTIDRSNTPQVTTSVSVPPVAPQTTAAPPATTAAVTVDPQFVPITPSTPVVPTTPQTTATPAVTQPLTPPGKYFGHYGQLCPVPEPDAMCQPEGPSFGGVVTEQVAGFTKCERNGDCCGCSSISCGSEWSPCNTFSAGNYGVMGVQDINIVGRSEQNGGGQIMCMGTEACANSVITGSNIKSIDADKAGSMRNAKVTLSSVVADFDMNCIGIGACEGLKLEINIPGPPPGFMCNPAWSGNLIEWASISCYGQDSCRGMEITINNDGCNRIEIQQIECYSPTACAGANFQLNGDVTVNNCDLIGSSAGIATGLAQVCGFGSGMGGGQWAPAPGQWVPV